MRIAFIGQKGWPAASGGVEKYVESLAAELLPAGHEVFIFGQKNYNRKDVPHQANLHLINVPALRNKNLEAISRTFFTIFALAFKRFDVIHFQSIGPASLIPLVKIIKPKTPIVFTFHCQDYHHRKWSFLARSYLLLGEKLGNRYADKVIVVSKELLHYANDKYQNSPLYIPNGAKIKAKVEAQEIHRLWNLAKDSYILSVGRLVRHKGIQYLIEAYRKLETDKKLVIVGGGSYTNDYVQELHDLAANDANIIFTGEQSGRTLEELFSGAACFVQPSESEGLSIALLEAMAYGLPCLASDIVGNSEALGDSGLFFQNKNSLDLQNKLNNLLDNQELKSQLGAKALVRIKQEYNWEDIARKTEAVYNDLVVKK